MTTDLVAWLREQLDADERGVEEWTRPRPDLLLSEVDAKRRIADWCVEVIGDRDLSDYGAFGSLKDDPNALAVTLAVETLGLPATPPVYLLRPGDQATLTYDGTVRRTEPRIRIG